jgi:hemerythrin-like domain-containing protein
MAGAGTRNGVVGSLPAIGAADPRLLAEPLDYLETEHYRMRAVLSLLDRFVSEPRPDVRAATARLAIGFIRSDLALRVSDENEGLFPLLRIRCEVADGLDRILERIAEEPARGAVVCAGVVRKLTAACDDRAIGKGIRIAVERFVRSQRRLLALEDAFVLPLARQRLTEADRCWLSLHMSERRQ